MFPDITKEILVTGGELVSIYSFPGSGKFHINLEQTMVDRLEATVADNGLEGQGSFVTVICLVGETQTLLYMQQINNQKLVAGLVYLDSYDEVLESVEGVRHFLLTTLTDQKISKYISDMNDIIKKLEKDKYSFIIRQQYMTRIQEGRPSTLGDVKTVNIGNDIAVTLSIGIGMNGNSYSQDYDYTGTFIDIAPGQGGDQTVVKDSGRIQYHGGKAQQMEKTTRVKARVKAHVLKELMKNKNRLLIMRYRLTDIDPFGATAGIYRVVVPTNKEAGIMVNGVTSSMCPMVDRFIDNVGYPEDMLLTRPKASGMVDQGTMLVIVDVNRPNITDKPALLRKVRTIVVLDHHRTSGEIIDDAALSYVEPYASSTCKMVAEALRHIADGIKVKPAEADAMYAGIVIDTQNLANQTGVRAFEAVAFLRHSGADITKVRKLFRKNMRDYQARTDAAHRAEVYMDAFTISGCSADELDSPTIIGAQTASELLEIWDIKASVALTDYNGTIYFNAHFIGEVNVQVMMEKLGGGGHRTIADTQMEDVSAEDAKICLKEVIYQVLEEGEVS